MVTRNLGFRFKLVSYNILSQTLLNDHKHLYRRCNPKDLEWPQRGQRIISELLYKRADIVCLQEVESEHLQTLFRPKLSEYGFECLYKKKTGYKIDGCAIFFKRKLFDLIHHKGIEFHRIDVATILNRDNVGIIAVLKPKLESPKESRLVIASTHLLFNPRRSDIRLAQLKLFMSELEELSFDRFDSDQNKRYHHPTILCGDFNSLPGSEINRFVLKNQVEQEETAEEQECTNEGETSHSFHNEHDSNNESSSEECDTINNLCDLNHTLEFKSVYPLRNRKGKSYVSTFSSCIVDYIFYTPRLSLDWYRELLTDDELRRIGPIPNSSFPSDHLTLEAKFTLR